MSRLVFFPAVVLLFLCPVYAQTNAVLRSSGAVKVNGAPVTSSTVVMEGDQIDTGKNSSASLLLPGRMISLAAASSFVYHGGKVVPNTSAAKLGSASVVAHDSDTGKDPKKKCISPKKPDKDKDCDDD
jgi:hypothetical protein